MPRILITSIIKCANNFVPILKVANKQISILNDKWANEEDKKEDSNHVTKHLVT